PTAGDLILPAQMQEIAMTNPVSPLPGSITASQTLKLNPDIENKQGSNIGQRLEQMLWAELLSHAGLEKAFTQAGGEAASAFSRYIVEAIAKDMAEQHPLGLGQAAQQTIAAPTREKPGAMP
ncbi:MAG: hypothetical protein L3J02_05435, partial [Henriciella sp.]|nr:hypothetical protein [Henriciella sp.]